MQKIKQFINRPKYFFQPSRIYSRVLTSNLQKVSSDVQFKVLNLPWGVIRIPVNQKKDVLCESILKYGIYDLSVTEAIWRLTKPGEIAVDVGANIGYTSSLLSSRVGKNGKVFCFEPNPSVYSELCENIKIWKDKYNGQNIYPYDVALSNETGLATLNIILGNRGESFIGDEISDVNAMASNTCNVQTERLDKILLKEKAIGILKIDVEGHELKVFEGAGKLIASNQVRDIIFEDHSGYPSNASRFLEGYGYTIFQVWKGFWKPILLDPNKNLSHQWEPPNYLATHDPKRAINLFQDWGWKSLQG
jgi:FkbM family methyltransferase